MNDYSCMFDMRKETRMIDEQRNNIQGYFDKEKFAVHEYQYSAASWKVALEEKGGPDIWEIPFVYNPYDEEDSEPSDDEGAPFNDSSVINI